MSGKVFLFILIVLFSFSCRYVGETVVNSQDSVETNVNSRIDKEIKGDISQPNENYLSVETDTKTFAKTFVVIGKFDDSKGNFAYTDHLIEFKENDSKGISIYIDNKEKASLKIETNRPVVRTDFLESDGERLFILVVGSSGFGTCGDSIFAIVKVNEKLDVKLSETNEPRCQGEYYPIKIENIEKSNKFYRQISIGRLKFNLDLFNWIKDKSGRKS